MSNIIIKNRAKDTPPIGVFMRTYNMPHFLVPWKIMRPGPEGQCPVKIPLEFDIFVRRGDETNPNGGCESNIITLHELTANLVLVPNAATDGSQGEPILRPGTGTAVQNQINIENMTNTGVWAHVQADNKDLLPTQILTGQSTIMYDVRPTLYLAVVNTYVTEGLRIREQELTTILTPILVGQTAVVSGSQWQSYSIDIEDTGNS